MARQRLARALLLLGCLSAGSCIRPPTGRAVLPQLARGRRRARQVDKAAWVVPFKILSEEELQWWKESMFGPEKSPPPPRSDDASSRSSPGSNDDNTKAGTSATPTAMALARFSQRLGWATDGGARALQTIAARSLVLGKGGGVWLRRRWRLKAGYCLLGLYMFRISGRVLARVRANRQSDSDIILDADDRALASRGTILDVEGQALLTKVRALGPPSPSSTSNSFSDIDRLLGADDRNGDGSCGWEAIKTKLERAIGLRCAGGKRGAYAKALGDALLELEETRDEADMDALGTERSRLAEQAVLLVQSRLCDTCLRSLRDGFVRCSSDLSELSAFWVDQTSIHRRMGVIKSVVLGRLYGQLSGKQAVVEIDQEMTSASDMLLDGYLQRLGVVQVYLQSRPRMSLEDARATEGGVFAQLTAQSLEVWVAEGMAMFQESVKEIAAALQEKNATELEDPRPLRPPPQKQQQEQQHLYPDESFEETVASVLVAYPADGIASNSESSSNAAAPPARADASPPTATAAVKGGGRAEASDDGDGGDDTGSGGVPPLRGGAYPSEASPSWLDNGVELGEPGGVGGDDAVVCVGDYCQMADAMLLRVGVAGPSRSGASATKAELAPRADSSGGATVGTHGSGVRGWRGWSPAVAVGTPGGGIEVGLRGGSEASAGAGAGAGAGTRGDDGLPAAIVLCSNPQTTRTDGKGGQRQKSPTPTPTFASCFYLAGAHADKHSRGVAVTERNPAAGGEVTGWTKSVKTPGRRVGWRKAEVAEGVVEDGNGRTPLVAEAWKWLAPGETAETSGTRSGAAATGERPAVKKAMRRGCAEGSSKKEEEGADPVTSSKQKVGERVHAGGGGAKVKRLLTVAGGSANSETGGGGCSAGKAASGALALGSSERSLRRELEAWSKITEIHRKKRHTARGGDRDRGTAIQGDSPEEPAARLAIHCADGFRSFTGGFSVVCATAAASACMAGCAALQGVVMSARGCAHCASALVSSPTWLACVVLGSAVNCVEADVACTGDQDGANNDAGRRADGGVDGVVSGYDGDEAIVILPGYCPDLYRSIADRVAAGYEKIAAMVYTVGQDVATTAAGSAEETPGGSPGNGTVNGVVETSSGRLKVGRLGLGRTCGVVAVAISAHCLGTITRLDSMGASAGRGIFGSVRCCSSFCASCATFVLAPPVRVVCAGGRAASSRTRVMRRRVGGAATKFRRRGWDLFLKARFHVADACILVVASTFLSGYFAFESAKNCARICAGYAGAAADVSGRLAHSTMGSCSNGVVVVALSALAAGEAVTCGAIESARCCASCVGVVVTLPVRIVQRAVALAGGECGEVLGAGGVATLGGKARGIDIIPMLEALTVAAADSSDVNDQARPESGGGDEAAALSEEAAGTVTVADNSSSPGASSDGGSTFGLKRPFSRTASDFNTAAAATAAAVAGVDDNERGALAERGMPGSSPPLFAAATLPKYWPPWVSSPGASRVGRFFKGSSGNISKYKTSENNEKNDDKSNDRKNAPVSDAPVAKAGSLSSSPASSPSVAEAEATETAQAVASSEDQPPPTGPQEREAADEVLARWASTVPSVGHPERSSARSRALVAVTARAANMAVPSSATVGAGVKMVGVSRALIVRAAVEASSVGCSRPARRKRVRAAVGLAVGAPFVMRFGRYLRDNGAELCVLKAEASAGLSSFFLEQLWEPCQAIGNKVFFRERSNLVDAAALEDAQTSLENMLRDFVQDAKNKVPEKEREKVVAAMDMSVVSRKLEKETRGAIRGTVSGRIPRMLLIQGTFLKKELLQAMEGIDELFQANQVTLRLISVVPAVLLVVGGLKASKMMLHAAASRRLQPTTLVHRSMRASVRKMERLLVSSRAFMGDEDAGAAGASRSVLNHNDTGKLVLLIHELQTVLRQNSSRFDVRVRRGLEEDLSDMTRGRPTVSQQLAIVHRMQRSYGFLRSEGF